MSKHKKIRFIIHYVKPTAQLLFRIRFPKGGPTCIYWIHFSNVNSAINDPNNFVLSRSDDAYLLTVLVSQGFALVSHSILYIQVASKRAYFIDMALALSSKALWELLEGNMIIRSAFGGGRDEILTLPSNPLHKRWSCHTSTPGNMPG